MNKPVKAHAKINVFLKVLKKRNDGYHDIESLLCLVELHDLLTIQIKKGNKGSVNISCAWPGVPEDSSNLAARAANVFYKATGYEAETSIHIDKNIPPGAGLGGGSSNAAAVLNYLNQVFDFPVSYDELCTLGGNIGADIPFFIKGRPAFATGIGDRLRPVEAVKKNFFLTIVWPGQVVDTALVYKKLNLRLTRAEKIHRLPRLQNLEAMLENDLETAATAVCPDIATAKAALLDAGATGTVMTGSGSAVFGLFVDKEQSLKARDQTAMINDKWKTYATRILI